MGIKVEVRPIRVSELVEAAENGSLKEMFGSGTAAVISPVAGFSYQDQYHELPTQENSTASLLKKGLTDIQQNNVEDKFNWTHKVS